MQMATILLTIEVNDDFLLYYLVKGLLYTDPYKSWNYSNNHIDHRYNGELHWPLMKVAKMSLRDWFTNIYRIRYLWL